MGAHRDPHRISVNLALTGGSLVLAGLLSSAMPVHAVDFSMRPSLMATNYIRVAPVEEFSGSFVEMIRNAAQQSGAVQAAAARWHAEERGVEASAAAQLPSGAFFGEVGLASGGQGSNPYAYGIRISVPIYDGYTARYATEAQTSFSDAAYMAAKDELAATLVDLVAAAASIRRAQDMLDAHHAHYAATKELLGAIKSERETGTASAVDTAQVEAQLAQIEIELKQAETARIQAHESFARIAGPAPSAMGTIGSIASWLPPDKAAAVAMAMAENPQLGNRTALASAAHLTRLSVQSSLGPELSFDLSAGANGDLFQSVSTPIEARAMFRLEVPLAFGTEAAVEQHALKAQAAQFEVHAAQNGVTAGIESAYASLTAVRSSLSLAYDALERSRSILNGIGIERELGERSIFEVLTAQSGLAQAKIRVSSLRYDIVIAEHLLAAQLGRIDEIYGLILE